MKLRLKHTSLQVLIPLKSFFITRIVDIGIAAWNGRQLLAEVDGQAHRTALGIQ